MPMTLSVRKYEKADYDRVREICVAAFTAIHDGFEDALGKTIFDYRYGDWREGYADYLRTIPDLGPDSKVYVVEDEGNVVGFVFTVIDSVHQIGEIGLNAVDPKYQGRGIGKKLYQFALDDLRGRGAEVAYVGTGADAAHAPARAAYRAVGFDKEIPSIHYFKTL
jgi:ribosomal protein S18 acetylase RimI-like enzyme